MKKRVNWKALIVSLVVVYLVAFLGSIFTSKSVGTAWYESVKPGITPPNFVFPIVWNILFFLIAISLYLAWTSSKPGKQERKEIAWVYGINLALNLLWSVFYFWLQSPIVAFFTLIILLVSIFTMISVSYRVNKIAAYLLVPYLLWVCFAGVLNWLSAF